MGPSRLQISLVPLTCFFFALLIPPLSAPAQVDVSVGIDGGLTSMTRGGDNATEVKRRTGFTFGGFAIVDFSGPVALRPRIGYIQKGSTFSREAEIRGPDGSVIISGVDEPVAKYNYIELSVPVSLQISTSGRLSPRLFAGPSLGRNVKAETEYVESYSDMVRVLDNSDSTRDYQVGLVFGGGFSFGLGEGGSFGLGIALAKSTGAC